MAVMDAKSCRLKEKKLIWHSIRLDTLKSKESYVVKK